MSILSQDNRLHRIVTDAVLVALAMLCSYLEFLLPITAMIPLPGFRLGLANVVVLAAFCLLSPTDAAVISFIRIGLSALLFGTATSLFFSAMGGLFSFLTLMILQYFGKKCSFVGVSVLSASAHNAGQIFAASLLFGSSVFFQYLPVLLFAAIGYGGIVGWILNLLLPRLWEVRK